MKIAIVDHHNGLSGGQRSISVFLNYLREVSQNESDFNFIIVLDTQKGDFYDWLVANKFESHIRLVKLNTADSRKENYSNVATRPKDILANIALLATPFELAKLFKKEKVDIAYGNSFKAGLFNSLSKLIHPIKTAFRVRTALDYSSHGWIDNFIFKSSNLIFANSDYVKCTIPVEFHQKTNVIYNHFSLRKSDLQHKSRGEFLDVLIIGRITERKRPHEVVDFLNKYPDFPAKFSFVGRVEENSNSYYQELLKKIGNSERSDSFQFIGFTDRIHELMLKYDIIFLPSIYEPLSRVVIESMALGCVLVTTNDSGNKELIVHGENGFLYDPGDLEGLHNTLEEIKNLGDYISIRKNARLTFEKHFNKEATVEAELISLEELLN